MKRRPLAIAIALCLLPAPAMAETEEPAAAPATDPREQALERLHDEASREEQRLMQGLAGGALVSLGAGAAMLATGGSDEAFRVAGGVTLGFALIDASVGTMILVANQRERRRWDAGQGERRAGGAAIDRARDYLLGEQRRKERGYRFMIGLDSAIAVAGGASALVSRFGVEHPDRWLAGGLSVAAQGLLLLVVDATGFVQSRRAGRSILGTLTPTTAVTVDGNATAMTLGVAGRF